jgi:hypothetical protein
MPGMATTVTLTADAPANLADSLGLAAGDRQAGDVLSLPHRDAVALVTAGVARFGSAAQDAATEARTNAGRAVRGFPLTPDAGVALAAGAALAGDPVALGENHRWTRVRLLASSDQAGTAVIEQALDAGGPWLRPVAPTAVAAGGTVLLDQAIAAPFVRGVLINGATAAAAARGYLSVATE